MTPDLALTFSAILAAGIGAQWLAWYLKQPSILFLLLIGIFIGPILGWFNPDQALGDSLFPLVSLGVAVILFEGSLTLEFHEVKRHGRVVQMMVSAGVLITIAIVGLSAYLIFDMDPLIALLFGSLVCVTGPTVINPILRNLRANKNVSNILRWEGIIVDPIGAIAVVLVFEYIISGGSGEKAVILLFGKILVVSALLGIFGAAALATLVKKHWIPEYLRNVFTLAYVLLIFSVSNHIEHESGLLTVTILGVALANWPKFPKNDIQDFKEPLSILLISVLFIVLAARLDMESIQLMGHKSVMLLAIVMLVARPIMVWISSYGSKLNTNEKLMISWVGPRGIVAAAMSSLFAIRLEDYDMAGVELLVPLVFIVIIGTVMIQGLTAAFVGNFLNVRQPSNNGVLIIGGNIVARTTARALKEQKVDVIIADNNYSNIAKERMEGIKTYFGNPVSGHANQHLNLIGFGHVFVMSLDQELNSLSEMNFRHSFGTNNIYRLRYNKEKKTTERQKKDEHLQSPWLFGESVTYNQLASMIAKNAKIQITNITKNYNFEQYQKDNKNYVALFMIDKNGVMKVFSSETESTNIDNGTKIISLVVDSEDPKGEKPTPEGEKKEHFEKMVQKEKEIQ